MPRLTTHAVDRWRQRFKRRDLDAALARATPLDRSGAILLARLTNSRIAFTAEESFLYDEETGALFILKGGMVVVTVVKMRMPRCAGSNTRRG